MGGGLGLLPSSEALLRTLNSQEEIEATVICGHNEKMLAMVREKYPAIAAVGYTDQVDKYMGEADLLVTKAGGLTTFEAIAAGTPCISSGRFWNRNSATPDILKTTISAEFSGTSGPTKGRSCCVFSLRTSFCARCGPTWRDCSRTSRRAGFSRD